jgi:spore maturation protein CgeB
MRILLAGNFLFEWYEEAGCVALERLGHEVVRFPWHQYFKLGLGKVENYAGLVGPVSKVANRQLIRSVTKNRIDLLLIWRGTHVTARTIQRIRELNPQCSIVSYNNDDPFSLQYSSADAPFNQRRLWNTFRSAIASYDMHFVYRHINVAEMMAMGAKSAHVLMPNYIPELHRPVQLSVDEQRDLGCDIAFVGHYEPDGREHYIRALVKAGLHTKLYGEKYWNQGILQDMQEYFGFVYPVYGEDYVKTLCAAKMNLCLLSRLNRDTYTRRCFEIPACGSMLISERTDDLTKMFKEDEEAVFFSTPEELAEKALWLKKNPSEIQRIAQAGMQRVMMDGHSSDARMVELLGKLKIPFKSIGIERRSLWEGWKDWLDTKSRSVSYIQSAKVK